MKHFVRKNKKAGKRGFTLTELLIAICIAAILMAIAIIGLAKQVQNSRKTVVQANMADMRTSIIQCLRENPDFETQAETSPANAVKTLNYYLDKNEQLSAPSKINECTMNLIDPYKNAYIVFLNPGYHTSTGHGAGDGTDSEVNIVIKSMGENGSTSSTANTIDTDDLCSIISMTNGTVSYGTVGFEAEDTSNVENASSKDESSWFIK